VVAVEEGDWKTYYPLHPADAAEIEADSKRFDNIEARIAAYPDVEFTIEDYWETGMEGVVQVAKLIESDTEYIGDDVEKLAREVFPNLIDMRYAYKMGYNKAKETLYTGEQVRMAIQKARVTNTENLMGTGVKLHRWSDDEILQLIKTD
jgi:hypothetical protein